MSYRLNQSVGAEPVARLTQWRALDVEAKRPERHPKRPPWKRAQLLGALCAASDHATA